MGIIPGQVSWSLVTEAAKAVRSTWEEVPSAGVSGAEPDVSSAGGWVGWAAAPLSAAGFWGSCAGFSGVSWAGFWEEVPCPPEGFALPVVLPEVPVPGLDVLLPDSPASVFGVSYAAASGSSAGASSSASRSSLIAFASS